MGPNPSEPWPPYGPPPAFFPSPWDQGHPFWSGPPEWGTGFMPGRPQPGFRPGFVQGVPPTGVEPTGSLCVPPPQLEHFSEPYRCRVLPGSEGSPPSLERETLGNPEVYPGHTQWDTSSDPMGLVLQESTVVEARSGSRSYQWEVSPIDCPGRKTSDRRSASTGGPNHWTGSTRDLSGDTGGPNESGSRSTYGGQFSKGLSTQGHAFGETGPVVAWFVPPPPPQTSSVQGTREATGVPSVPGSVGSGLDSGCHLGGLPPLPLSHPALQKEALGRAPRRSSPA